MILTAEQLKAIVPNIRQDDLDKYMPYLLKELPTYHIDTPSRIGGFVAQVAHESGSFRAVREMISDVDAEKQYGIGKAVAKQLGNVTIGDGGKFKGRGLIQVTGRGNYTWCSESLFKDNRLLINPTLLEQPQFAVESACWFWTTVKPLNAIADHPEDWSHIWDHNGKTYSKIEWMTLLVNGGQNGLAERVSFYNRARHVLGF
jgi:putative chitinase